MYIILLYSFIISLDRPRGFCAYWVRVSLNVMEITFARGAPCKWPYLTSQKYPINRVRSHRSKYKSSAWWCKTIGHWSDQIDLFKVLYQLWHGQWLYAIHTLDPGKQQIDNQDLPTGFTFARQKWACSGTIFSFKIPCLRDENIHGFKFSEPSQDGRIHGIKYQRILNFLYH